MRQLEVGGDRQLDARGGSVQVNVLADIAASVQAAGIDVIFQRAADLRFFVFAVGVVGGNGTGDGVGGVAELDADFLAGAMAGGGQVAGRIGKQHLRRRHDVGNRYVGMDVGVEGVIEAGFEVRGLGFDHPVGLGGIDQIIVEQFSISQPDQRRQTIVHPLREIGGKEAFIDVAGDFVEAGVGEAQRVGGADETGFREVGGLADIVDAVEGHAGRLGREQRVEQGTVADREKRNWRAGAPGESGDRRTGDDVEIAVDLEVAVRNRAGV